MLRSAPELNNCNGPVDSQSPGTLVRRSRHDRPNPSCASDHAKSPLFASLSVSP